MNTYEGKQWDSVCPGLPSKICGTAWSCFAKDVIPYCALKRLANHKTNSDVTSGDIISDAERLREPMRKIINELSSNCGIQQKNSAPAAIEREKQKG